MAPLAVTFIFATLATFGMVHAGEMCVRDCSGSNFTPLCAIVNGHYKQLTSMCEYDNLVNFAQLYKGSVVVGIALEGYCNSSIDCHTEELKCMRDSGPVCSLVDGKQLTFGGICGFAKSFHCNLEDKKANRKSYDLVLMGNGECKFHTENPVPAQESGKNDCSGANITPLCAIVNGHYRNLTSMCEYDNLYNMALENKKNGREYDIVALADEGFCNRDQYCRTEETPRCMRDSGPVCTRSQLGEYDFKLTYDGICHYAEEYHCNELRKQRNESYWIKTILKEGKCEEPIANPVPAHESGKNDCSGANFTPLCAIVNGHYRNLTSMCEYDNLYNIALENKKNGREYDIVALADEGFCNRDQYCLTEEKPMCMRDSGPVCIRAQAGKYDYKISYDGICHYAQEYHCNELEKQRKESSWDLALLREGKCEQPIAN